MGASSMTVQDHASWDAVFAITLFHLFCVSDELLESVIPRTGFKLVSLSSLLALVCPPTCFWGLKSTTVTN